ncbi:MAG: D-alanyl-D-alanine carboxypeptidase [Eubacterium sp.]|nr:D-alanyl-D-alanine carboxypeptidase [Eubacterium sp.]
MEPNENGTENKGLIIFLRLILVLVVLAVLGIFAIIFVNLMKKRMEPAEVEDYGTEMDAEYETTPLDAHTVADALEENPDVVANGDAADIPPDSWMSGKIVHDFYDSDNTIHLPKADLSLFQKAAEEEEEGEKTKAEDAVAKGPWDEVSLRLDSVEGSINYSTPGDASKTKQLTSTYMILVDLDTDEIVAERDGDKVVSPASMTKVLTVLTAREFINADTLDDTFTITTEITDYVDQKGASAVGFKPGDEVTVRDLLYGTILPSGADAALGLAEYCCGSQEAFVDMMNQKVDELGLSETAHFTNVVGMYDKDLHCTMKDMALIMSMAIQDDLLLDVLSKRKYNTDITYEEDFPDGIEISNWFLRRIEDKPMDGDVIAAKTGFVNESGCCAVSYYESDTGKHYICVTGNSFSSWRTIYDHLSVYRSLTY